MFLPSPWSSISVFGNSELMLPAAAILAVWLMVGRAEQLAFWWIVFFLSSVGLVLATKIAFLGWGVGIRSIDFTGISGHTALAAMVLPITAFFLLYRRRSVLQLAGVIGGFILAVLIGVSRYVLDLHSPSEIVAGFVLGAVTVIAVILLSKRMPSPVSRPWLLIGILALVPVVSVEHWSNSHGLVVELAQNLSGRAQPFSRTEWHDACKHQADC